MITVLIADDHPVMRDGLATLIDTVGMTTVAQAESGRDAVREAVRHRPDVVLMDLNMPHGSGIDATREIAVRCPGSKVLVLTMSEDDESIAQAIRAGARGYILKGATQEEITRAITTVAAGGVLFSAAIADRVLSQLSEPKLTTPAPRPLPELTARELEVLSLLADGHRNAAIASGLGISAKTVANHLSIIFTKLCVLDRSQAIIAAREAGLGSSPDPRGR
jgi:DNA-binding NarL/FixJ family response regulator